MTKRENETEAEYLVCIAIYRAERKLSLIALKLKQKH